MPLMRLDMPVSPTTAAKGTAAPTGGEGAANGGGSAPAEKQGTAEPIATAGPFAVLIGYGALVVGALGGILLWYWHDPVPFAPAEGISVFAPLYIVTQAIERFIEPFSTYLGVAKPTDKAAEQTPEQGNMLQPAAMKKVYDAIGRGELELAAQWQQVVDRIRRNKAVIAWGLASLLGMILCGLFGIFFLRLAGFTGVPEEIDIIISGLAVGSGTKPLHDLISNIQKAKEQKDDPGEKKAA